ncbi:hypothetical protein Nepgr_031240 [Nepenthes gracilis]|uniref:Uncharacterized protein n=1 Tax=Nepenthes gracilis TaxID=150966 RepID=A0AAD3Y4M1_NEPGR|nr:hypothetical protein Nepgr_031240 [Nepenthes gracilis]
MSSSQVVHYDSAQATFNSTVATFNSTVATINSTAKSISTVAILSIVLGTIATVAIVVAVIYCLKRASKSISSYAHVTLGQSDQAAKGRGQSKDYYGAADPAFPVIRDSQLEAGTMGRFLGEVAREKPIRFAPQQLAGFTQNFSKVLGSGGFGVVYEGQFPNGVLIAVKVLNNSSGTLHATTISLLCCYLG